MNLRERSSDRRGTSLLWNAGGRRIACGMRSVGTESEISLGPRMIADGRKATSGSGRPKERSPKGFCCSRHVCGLSSAQVTYIRIREKHAGLLVPVPRLKVRMAVSAFASVVPVVVLVCLTGIFNDRIPFKRETLLEARVKVSGYTN